MVRTPGSSLRVIAALLSLPALVACQAMRDVDAAMRRVDVLDRMFERKQERPPPMVVRAPPARSPNRPKPPASPLPAPEMTAAVDPGAASGIEAAPFPHPTPAEAVSPADRQAMLLRRHPWLTRFWSELTATEQGQVTRQLRATGAVVPANEVPATWDRMGLGDRLALIYGGEA